MSTLTCAYIQYNIYIQYCYCISIFIQAVVSVFHNNLHVSAFPCFVSINNVLLSYNNYVLLATNNISLYPEWPE